jgi:hypothetical protein
MKMLKFSEAKSELLEEHAKRYGEVLKLSLAASFAAILFLPDIESQHIPANTEVVSLLRCMWACFLLSTLLGTLSLSIWVIRPKKRLAGLSIHRHPNGEIARVMIGSICPWYEILFFWGHVASFLLGSVTLAYLKLFYS